jgi:hypothetical protein
MDRPAAAKNNLFRLARVFGVGQVVITYVKGRRPLTKLDLISFLEATMRARKTRVAVMGGRGTVPPSLDTGKNVKVTTYKSSKEGRPRDYLRLVESLKRGTYTKVFILTRWNGHAATRKVIRVCKLHNVPYELCL